MSSSAFAVSSARWLVVRLASLGGVIFVSCAGPSHAERSGPAGDGDVRSAAGEEDVSEASELEERAADDGRPREAGGCGVSENAVSESPGPETPASDAPELPEGFLLLHENGRTVEYRPEHEEVARAVLREAPALRQRFEATEERLVSLIADAEDAIRPVWEPVDSENRRRMAEVIAGTFVAPDEDPDLHAAYRTAAERTLSIFSRGLQDGAAYVESLSVLREFALSTAAYRRFRVVSFRDIEEGRVPGFLLQGRDRKPVFLVFSWQHFEKKQDDLVSTGNSPIPDYVPVLVDSGEERGYRVLGTPGFWTEHLASLARGREDKLSVRLLAHEAAELALAAHLRWNDPFIRWFSDGVAEYAAFRCIAEVRGDEAYATARSRRENDRASTDRTTLLARVFARGTGTDLVADTVVALYGFRFRDAGDDRSREGTRGDDDDTAVPGRINLLGWTSVGWQETYPELIPAHETAHYASALAEIERLVETYGAGALHSLVRRLAAAERKDQLTFRLAFFIITGSHDFWSGLREYSRESARRLAKELGEDASVTDAAAWYREALARILEHDLEGAWRALEVLAELEPAWLQTRLLRALVLAAREGETGRRSVRRELALLRTQLGKQDELDVPAVSPEALTLVLDVARKAPELHCRILADLLDLSGSEADAATRYRDLGLGNGSESWYLTGKDLLECEFELAALGLLGEAARRAPENPDVRYWKCVALHEVERYADAVECYDEVVRLDGAGTRAWYARGRSLYALERYGDALHSFEKAIDLEPSYRVGWYAKWLTLSRLGRAEEARAALEKAAELGYERAQEELKELEQSSASP